MAAFALTILVGCIVGVIVYLGLLPQCFIEGGGLTQFGIWAEYSIAGLFSASAFGLWKKRHLFERDIVWILVLACMFGLGSEISFTMSADPYGRMNVIGHILGFGLFVCLFRTFVIVGIKRPQASLLRELALTGHKLSESEAFFSAAFKANPDPMVILSLPEGRIQGVNETFLTMTGYSEEEVLGKTGEELGLWLQSADRNIFLTALAAEGCVKDLECRFRLQSGQIRIALVSAQVVDAGGKLRAVVVARDVTGEKEAHEALSRSHQELEERVRERTAELANSNEALRAEIELRKKAEETLLSSKEELKRLSAFLLSRQETERKQLAREIHDSLGQLLAAVKFSIERAIWELSEKAAERAPTETLQHALAMVQGAIEEVRRIQMDLRPALLDDIGLVATLSWFLREFQKTYPNIRIKKNLLAKEEEVPEGLKIVIFRVLQEALNNVAKHSRADKVEVHLYIEESQLVFSIKDNGVGVERARESLQTSPYVGTSGLLGMRERVELSGGRFALRSEPGKGTQIEARWSLNSTSPS